MVASTEVAAAAQDSLLVRGRSTKKFPCASLTICESDGTVLHRYVKTVAPATVATVIRELEAQRSRGFLDFYFSDVAPRPGTLEHLVAQLDTPRRDQARRRLFAYGRHVLTALPRFEARVASPEVRRQLATLRRRMEPFARRIRARKLDRDVGFLVRLMRHEQPDVRRRALERARRILPFPVRDAAQLEAHWKTNGARMAWDAATGRYRS